MELLLTLPRARWTERDLQGQTLLHYAAQAPNVVALVLLIQSGLPVDARTTGQRTPAHIAACNDQSRALEVLCAAGADLTALAESRRTPLDYALSPPVRDACVRVLLANGMRLSTVKEDFRRFITPELEAFERGVLRCRGAVVALLRVKRVCGQLLVRWDRYLLRQMALDLWATRCAKEWQHN